MTVQPEAPVGAFDSGIGGLSILRAVRQMRCRRCGPGGEILVVRALQNPAGHAALKVLTVAEAVPMLAARERSVWLRT